MVVIIIIYKMVVTGVSSFNIENLTLIVLLLLILFRYYAIERLQLDRTRIRQNYYQFNKKMKIEGKKLMRET